MAGVAHGASWALPHGLTEAQHVAVTADDAMLCVLAGAGAGKTRVLTLRVARRILDTSAEARHVLVCTFSRKAADELRRRLWLLDVPGEVRAATFHRTARALLVQHALDRGASPPMVAADRRRALRAILEDAPGSPRRPPGRPEPAAVTAGRLDAEIGWAKSRLVGPQDYAAQAARHRRRAGLPHQRAAELYAAYETRRRRRRELDLDDLLIDCARVLSSDHAFADAVRWRFRHLFVDEMQDVNPAQFRLLTLLLGDDPDLFVVGDPHQSVYGWNGAEPELLVSLPTLLTGMRVVRLDENHRCSPEVVAVAAAALGLEGPQAPASSRPPGALPRLGVHETDAEEAAWVAHEVWRARSPGRRWSELAVLARTNSQLDAVATALGAQRIPYRLAGADLGPASDVSSGRRRAGRTAALEEDGPGPSARAEPVDDEDDDQPGGVGANPVGGDAVLLSTFHRAKGLQWPDVYVIGLSDGLTPLSSARTERELAEEQRLLYVAMTRAESALSLSWARRRDEDGGGVRRRPSRWLGGVQAALGALSESRQPAVSDVSARVAALRARLAPERPGPDSLAPMNRGRTGAEERGGS
jgi:DNA helicase II / ATP-dependent DNA helicase PcrA